jgi:putative FmdB family regulatory protein
MPNYEFECTQCGKVFSEKLSFQQRQQRKIKCPKCRSAKVEQLISAVFVKTSKK